MPKSTEQPETEHTITLTGRAARLYTEQQEFLRQQDEAEGRRLRNQRERDKMLAMKSREGADNARKHFLQEYLEQHNAKLAEALGIPLASFPPVEVTDDDLDHVYVW